MIKLIVSDVDGTLVPEGTNNINPELFELILRLKKKGVYFAVASGRHKCSIEKIFAPVKEEDVYKRQPTIWLDGVTRGGSPKSLRTLGISSNTS